MNEPTKPHFASSLTLDDWLDEPNSAPTQNWLLTYIDVFVLIVMLVVTLIALSSFEKTTPAKSYQKVSSQIRETESVKIRKQPLKKPSSPIQKQPEQKTMGKAAPLKKREKSEQMPLVPVKNKPLKLVETGKQKIERRIEHVLPPAKVETLEEKVSQPVSEKPDDQKKAQQALQQKLNSLGLQDKIHMTVEKGYAQLEIQDNILYQSSAADLSESGKAVLKRLTPLLRQSEGLIYIEGHTDNRPIKTARFPSNWELGAARATSVLHFLAEQQIDPGRMRAVTYADTKPIADNNSAEGRQKNRRVNIVIKVGDED